MANTAPEPDGFTVTQVCAWFHEVERRYGLLARQEGGVYYWRLMRMPLYYALTEKLRLFGVPHPAPPPGIGARLHTVWRIARDAVLRNPFLPLRSSDYVVMPHSRNVGGDDIYTRALRESLPAGDTLTLYKDWIGHQLPGSCNMTGGILWQSLLTRRRNRTLSPETIALLTQVQEDMEQRFGIRLPLAPLALKLVVPFRKAVKYYTHLFRRRRAKTLYLAVGYDTLHFAAIEAAHRCGMEVVELQHGTFTPYHLGYSFPDADAPVPYSPDEFLCFGRFWPENTALPPQTRPRIIGAPYIEALAGKNAGVEKIPGSIVFTSQGVIGEPLLDFAVACARCLPQKRIIFRLHPSEDWATYEALAARLSPPGNFSLSHREPNIFRLLAQTEVQAGVFSTTLFEGMVLACRTVVIDMAGVEYMAPVIASGDALLVRTPEEFCARIDDAPPCRDAEYYYAPPATDFRRD